MATKGTKYSDVNFNVPEGADPLGIGVPDLGVSSYDPIATIRAGWLKNREERLIKAEQRREDYQKFLETLPTFEAINQKVAGKLNERVIEMGRLAHQRYKSGAWSPFAKTETGASTERELQRMQKEVITEGQLYNAMLPKYKAAEKYLSDPENIEKIDMDLTRRNMSAFTEAEDIDAMNRALTKPLVVLKPEPVELNEYLNKMIDMYIPGEDKGLVSSVFDPEMNKWKLTEVTYKDPDRVIRGMRKIYRNMEDKYKNEVNRRYLQPETIKETKDGVPISEEDWFISQYVPEYAKKLDVQTVAAKEEKETGLGILRGAEGDLNLQEMQTTREIGTKVQATTLPYIRTRRGGKIKYGEPEEGEEGVPMSYNSVSLPLSGIDAGFIDYIDNTYLETATGNQPELGRVATHSPVSIDFMPVWEGPPQIIDAEWKDEETGDLKKEAITINPGDRIPNEIEAELISRQVKGGKDQITYKPFLITNAVYGATITEKDLGPISWEDYMSKHGKATIMPFDKGRRAFYAALLKKGYNTAEIEEAIRELDDRLNSAGRIFK